MKSKRGTLYVVGIHIGNIYDLSPRAVTTLSEADVVACEERREGERLLGSLNIRKPLIEINEHTEVRETEEIILQLAAGKSVALISDCGMPVFADPGAHLISIALETGISVEVVPGPTSLTTALAVSGFDVRRFYFYGFLSPKRPERKSELSQLRSFRQTLVFLDAPYRLVAVLEDMAGVFGASRQVCVACDLTLKTELIRRGTLKSLIDFFQRLGGKREFVIIVEGYRP